MKRKNDQDNSLITTIIGTRENNAQPSPSLKKRKANNNNTTSTKKSEHSYESNIQEYNSIFNLIFPNQWKNLIEFIEELFVKYDDYSCFLSQKLKYLSTRDISSFSKYFIVIPPNAPNLENVFIDYHENVIKSLSTNETFNNNNILDTSNSNNNTLNNLKLQNSIIFKQQTKLSEIVDLIIESNFRIENKPNHVLCSGFSKIRPNASDGISNMTTIQSYYPNSVIDIVKGKDWENLLFIIGDCMMKYILQHCIVIKLLPRNCFLQITGIPICKYCTNLIQTDSIKKLMKTDYNLFNNIEKDHNDDAENNSNQQILLELDEQDVEMKDGEELIEENEWIDLEIVNNSDSNRIIDRKCTNIYLPRQMILYSNKKNPILGFPQRHILNTTSNDINGAKKLFNFIFYNSKELPKKQNLKGFGNLLEILLELKNNQKKLKSLPYLLSLYCPLKPIQKRKLINDKISINDQEQPIIYKKLKKIINEGKNLTNKFEDLLCTQEDNEDLNQISNNSSQNSSECITPIIESEIFLNSSEQFENLIQMTHSSFAISKFLKSVLKKLIPKSLFGSEHNMYTIFGNIDKIVKLGRFESITLHELMLGIKINDFNFLNDTKKDILKFKKQTKMIQNLILFIFKHLILILLSTHFYITESDHQRTRLLYLRRETWEYINRVSFYKFYDNASIISNEFNINSNYLKINQLKQQTNNLLNNNNLHNITNEKNQISNEVNIFKKLEKFELNEILKDKILPYASVRLLPKQTSARPIINLGKRIGNGENSYSVNSKLRDLLYILKFETERNSELLNSSVFNPMDMYYRILPFIKMWKNEIIQVPLYIVKMDIKGAYDSIPHEKLFKLITEKVLLEEEYISLKYCVIRPYIGKLITKFERFITCPNQFMHFTKLVNKILSQKYCKSIFIDQVSHSSINFNEIYEILKEHLFKNVIKFKNHFFIQIVGIPQGGIISPILSSLLYADFERQCLNHLPGGSSTSSRRNSYFNNNNDDHSSIILFNKKRTTTKSNNDHAHTIATDNNHQEKNENLNENELELSNIILPNSISQIQNVNNNNNGWNYYSNDSTLKYIQMIPSFNSILTTTTLTPPQAPKQQLMNEHHISSNNTSSSSSSGMSSGIVVGSSPPIVINKNVIDSNNINCNKQLEQTIISSNNSSLSTTMINSSSSSTGIVTIESIGVLLRLIDDFLYITNNRNAAQQFLERLNQGDEEYGIKINSKKTKVNFDTIIASTIGSEQNIIEYKAETIIRWCGFCLNTLNMNITIDYSRYTDGPLQDKVSHDCKTPGLHMCRKLKQTISWKCTPLVIDGTINSKFTCYLNIYQLFLFVAMKFHTMMRYKMKRSNSNKFYTSTISDIIGYMWICIQSRKKIILKEKSNCELQKLQVQYLGICAFYKIFQKKQSFYSKLGILNQLRILKRNFMQRFSEKEFNLLMEVTLRKHSTELLDSIKY